MKRKKVFLIILAVCITYLQSCKNISDEGYTSGDLKGEEYQEGYDYQKYFTSTKICRSDQGYYFFRTPYLFFFDETSGKTVKVCGLPDCNHNDSSCNAYFDPMLFNTNSIWFYNNQLYIEGAEEKNSKSHFLYQLSLDGSKRKQICYLFKTEENYVDFSLIIHRDFAYYCNYGKNDLTNDSCTLYRVKLTEGSKPEEMHHYKGIGASIFRIRGYGNDIYFQTGEYEDRQGNSYSSGFYRINISSKKVEAIAEDFWPNDYFADGNYLYYFSKDNQLIRMDLNTKETAEIYQAVCRSYISYDGKYLYIDNGMDLLIHQKDLSSREICVLDMTGKQIDTIALPNVTECFFGDSKYLFAIFNNEMKAFDKTQIGEKTKEWLLLQ